MVQVSNQEELQRALAGQEEQIQVIRSFPITSQISISRTVTISSPPVAEASVLTKAADYSGVMFRSINGGSLTLQNIILDGDSEVHPAPNADNRSLILVTGGRVNLESGAVLRNNNAYLEGGGVYLSGAAGYINTLIMSGNARISDCYSRTSGGGIMAAVRNGSDQVTISDSALIEGNQAANGGGIYMRSYVSGTGGTLTISDQVQITGNQATGTGGGICYSGFREGGSTPVSLVISGNAQITSNSAVHGGGIYFYGANSGDRFELSGQASVSGNTATGNGGGLSINYVAGGADVTIRSALENNQAGTGGGMYLLTDSGGRVALSDARISGNSADLGASGSGGGVWINNMSADFLETALSDVTIENNSAAAQGGGVYLIPGPGRFVLNVRSSSVTANTAEANGGGLIVGSAGGGDIRMADSRINQNRSGGFGGGFYFSNTGQADSTIVLFHTEVNDNQAEEEGGGLRFTSSSGTLETVLTDCPVTGNRAGGSGGGIWNGGSEDTLILNGSTVVTENETMLGHGGGIYFNSDRGTCNLQDQVKVTYNRAEGSMGLAGNRGGGICLIPGTVTIRDQVEIAYNRAARGGGGLSLSEESKLIMTGGSIHGNETPGNGGGIYLTSGVMTMSGGSLYSNMAYAGGGIYNGVEGTVTLTGAADVGGGGLNTATGYGPGICNYGRLNAEGQRNLENGVFIENRDAVVRLEGPLTGTSAIQIDNSDYVSPNPEGTPIVIAQATPQYPVLSQTDAAAFKKPPMGFENWEVRLSEDKTQVLLAPVRYRITYENLMGADNPNPDTYTAVTPTIRLEDPIPLPGYRFVGWFDSMEGGNRVVEILEGSSGDITLYARWEIISPDTHRIIYEANDPCGCPARCIPQPVEVTEGASVKISCTVPVRCGFCFAGWNTAADGSGNMYRSGEVIADVREDMVLYAQWGSLSGWCCR